MNRTPDLERETGEVLLRELGKSSFPDQERFHKNLLARLESERIRPLIDQEADFRRKRTSWLHFACAASFAILIIAAGTYWLFSGAAPLGAIEIALGNISTSNDSSQDNAIYAGDIIQSHADSQASLLLSDRSLIRIDKQSSVEFIEKRKLQLRNGRLFAEISRTAKLDPFQITANNLSVTVLGTSFEVDSLEKQTTVTVFHGSVRVDWGNQSKTLAKGESVSISADGQSSSNRTVETDMPNWAAKLRLEESKSVIIKAMQEHFPSRSVDIPQKP